jgi:hypothetical protein
MHENEYALDDMKEIILADWDHWTPQRGPNDYVGYERYVDICNAIEAAETWDDLASAAPPSWSTAVVNRCHRNRV